VFFHYLEMILHSNDDEVFSADCKISNVVCYDIVLICINYCLAYLLCIVYFRDIN